MQMDVSQSDANDFIITKNISTVKIKLQTEIRTLCYPETNNTVDGFIAVAVLMYAILMESKPHKLWFFINTLLKIPLLFVSLFLHYQSSYPKPPHIFLHYSVFLPCLI